MNYSDLDRNAYTLRGSLGKHGYARWFHSFRGVASASGEVRTFFVEYMVMNPALGGEQPILGQHPYFKKRGMKPSYVQIKAGVYPGAQGQEGRQINAYYPIASLKITGSPFILQAEDCFYSENRIYGCVDISEEEARHRSLMTDSGFMEWDLEVHKAVACHTGLIGNRFFTAIGALESFWHGEGIRSFYRGTISLDGVTYQVTPDNCYGYADKHWGRSFNSPVLRIASGHLTSKQTGKELKHSVLAIDGCCPKFLCFPLKRRLMIQLTHAGEDFEFHFAMPRLLCRSKWKVKQTNKRFIWQISAQNKNALIKLSLHCTREQMMALLYETPDGTLPGKVLLSGGAGTGTLELYRLQDGSAQLLDILSIEDALCEYQPEN